jgi:hypothetical protein
MEKFINFLIWVQFIPISKAKGEGAWTLNFISPKFLLSMSVILVPNGFYLHYVFNQLLTDTDQTTLSDWSVLVFKILCLLSSTIFPFMLGSAACKLGDQTCHARMYMPVNSLAYVSGLLFVINAGVGGIHLKSHTGSALGLLPLGVAICVTFIAYLSGIIVFFAWLYDYLAHWSNVAEQELLTTAESDEAIGMFQDLKAGLEWLLLATLSHVQILLVFSLYNTLQGEVLSQRIITFT